MNAKIVPLPSSIPEGYVIPTNTPKKTLQTYVDTYTVYNDDIPEIYTYNCKNILIPVGTSSKRVIISSSFTGNKLCIFNPSYSRHEVVVENGDSINVSAKSYMLSDKQTVTVFRKCEGKWYV